MVPAVRGQIVDDTGRALVTNTDVTGRLGGHDGDVAEKDGGAAVLHRLARLLGMSYKPLAAKLRLCAKGVKPPCWAGSPYQPIPVDAAGQRPGGAADHGAARQYPGVTAQVQPVVEYPMPEGANPAQVLGYLQPITPQEIKDATSW